MLKIAALVLMLVAQGSPVAQGFPVRRSLGEGGSPAFSPPPTIDDLIAQTVSVPPEFAADVLVTIATSGKVTDRARRIELLERAYTLAGAAERAAPVSATGRSGTRSMSLALSSGLGLDRTTLQTRIALEVLTYDPRRARELFSFIDFDLEPTPCTDATVPHVEPYYHALTAIGEKAFPATPTGRDEALRFVELAMWRARLPGQFASLVTVVKDFGKTVEEQEFLLSTLATVLDVGVRDPRGFAMVGNDMVRAVAVLADSARERASPNAVPLMHALRRYVVLQLTGPRCSDGYPVEVAGDMFNAHARAWPNEFDGIKALTEQETTASREDERATIVSYRMTPDAQRLHDEFQALLGSNGVRTITAAIKASETWRAQAEKHLSNVVAWTGGDHDDSRDFFQEKATLFENMLALQASPAELARAARAYVAFLREYGLRRDEHALWFYRARTLLLVAKSKVVVPGLQQLLEESDQPVLALYARVQRVLGS